MRSSGSTHSRSPEDAIRLLVERRGDDHPKACTGRRLLDRGLARAPAEGRTVVARPVVLDPHAPRPLSLADREAALRGGLLAVDCSWNALAERGGAVREGRRGGAARRLPWLLAGNPQHFGRLAELNTAEALSAALYLLGEEGRAQDLLSGFPGGIGWFELNRRFLDAYRGAADAESIRAAERELFR